MGKSVECRSLVGDNAVVESLHQAETVVLVEGESDRRAVLAAAQLLEHHLEGIDVVAMGGATNVASIVARYASQPEVRTLIGLCDEREQDLFLRQLPVGDVFVCCSDLEDELIRALGVEAMIHFIETQGELKAFRTLQKQPAQRDRSVEQHLHRFCGSRATRKVRYGGAIIASLHVDQLPEPLAALIDRL